MDLQELKERQSWSLQKKIDHALFTIETFIARTNGQCYVAFSGGKDSTVLLDLVRMVDKDIEAVFVNTGNEYPDIIKFVRHLCDDLGYNIREIHPKMKPREIWAKYGFPLVSKEQAEYIEWYRKYPKLYESKKKMREENPKRNFGKIAKKWQYLMTATYDTSKRCCQMLKKNPSAKYGRESKKARITGMMADESLLRQTNYIRRGGCNSFSDNILHSESMPLAIWTEKDVWDYIKLRNLEISEIYAKGAKRTGCVGCGFGCQFKDDHRWELLYRLYPKYYEMIMNYTNNGVTFREALRKMLSVVGKELPDESGEIFFDY